MTALLDKAVTAARTLPEEVQDGVARVLLQLIGEDGALTDLTPDEEAAVLASRAAARRGEFATDEEVAAVWAKHGL
jgi:hypothetical protein